MDRDYFLNLANKIEGYKTRLKELHWSAPSHAIHILTDEFSKELGDFEDGIIENAIPAVGFIYPGELSPVLPSAKDFETVLVDLRGIIVEIKREASDAIMWTGVTTQVEDFFKVINRYIYLSEVEAGNAKK